MKDLRPCTVNGRKALFHLFEQFSKIVPPSPMVGGHSGDVTSEVLAIVEYEDGTVERAYINSLIFTDRETREHIEPTIQPAQTKQRQTQEKTKCSHCKDADNLNATIFADVENKECFVYCCSCGIETTETFKSKKAAISAFNSGKNKQIKEVAENG